MGRRLVDRAGLARHQRAEIAEGRGDVAHVGAALGERLAGVERLQPGQVLGVAVDPIGDAVQQPGALADASLAPGAVVEGRAGGGDGAAGIHAVGLGGLRDHALVDRADDVAGGLGRGGLPLAGDEKLGRGHGQILGSGPVEDGRGRLIVVRKPAGRHPFSDVDMVENVTAGDDQRKKEHVACGQVRPVRACKSGALSPRPHPTGQPP